MTQTFITGKDAALEDSIKNFQNKLKELGFNIEEVSWLNPVPNVWSVHIRDVDCPQCFSNGKGATKKAALASALGEYLERLSTNYFWADFYLGKEISESEFVHYPSEKWFPIENQRTLPEGLLDPLLRDYFDPDNDLPLHFLIDLQSGNSDRGIVALPYIRQSDQQVVYIPQSIIANLFVSNGMSAGNTKYEARVQGLSEVLERFVKNRVITEAISLPEIPQCVIDGYPTIKESITKLEEEGFPVLCYDASLGGEYPVVCVILFNPSNGTSFASFGAHPNFQVAFERAVTELLQGRSLKDLDVFSPPSFNNDDVSDYANLETHFIDSSGLISWDIFKSEADYDFVHWDFSGISSTTEQEFANLMEIFNKCEQEVYIMDYEHLGVYACRIIVPDVSNIYPVDDLIYANNNMGMYWREILLSLPYFYHPRATYQGLLDELDEQCIDDMTRVREFLGIVAEKDSAMQTLRVGELKSMLHLAMGNLEDALEWANWTVNMNASVFSAERNNYYRCLINSIELFLDENRESEHYRMAFEKMYGKETVERVWAIVQGANPFYGLQGGGVDLDNLRSHQKLLEAYRKVQKAKINAIS